MADDIEGAAKEVGTSFISLVVKSPPALIAIVVSAFFGYGIAFVLFDYRKAPASKSHYAFHCVFGLGYAAVVFCLVNFDLLSRKLTLDQITERIPLTLLVSFVVAFAIMLIGALWREFSKPYAG